MNLQATLNINRRQLYIVFFEVRIQMKTALYTGKTLFSLRHACSKTNVIAKNAFENSAAIFVKFKYLTHAAEFKVQRRETKVIHTRINKSKRCK
jgi:hypothetical protein